MVQLQKFQALLAGSGQRTTKFGACIMVCYNYMAQQLLMVQYLVYHFVQVFFLCFAVFVGGWAPQKNLFSTSASNDYVTAPGMLKQ